MKYYKIKITSYDRKTSSTLFVSEKCIDIAFFKDGKCGYFNIPDTHKAACIDGFKVNREMGAYSLLSHNGDKTFSLSSTACDKYHCEYEVEEFDDMDDDSIDLFMELAD